MTRSDTPPTDLHRIATPALPAPERASSQTPAAARDVLLAAQAETRRGLKAGRAALVDAKSAYGEAQWSGEHDRRPEPGLLVRARL